MGPAAKSATDWAEAAEALLALVAAWVVLAILPLRGVLRCLGLSVGAVAESPCPSPSAVPPMLGAVARAIERAQRRLPLKTRCLHHALAGALMLRRRRRPATIVLGVRTRDGHLRAHAWLLSDGMPVIGTGTARPFTPLAALG